MYRELSFQQLMLTQLNLLIASIVIPKNGMKPPTLRSIYCYCLTLSCLKAE